MKLSKSIFRAFDLRAKSGQTELLKQKLSDTSVKVVAGKPGNVGYFFGESLSWDGNDLLKAIWMWWGKPEALNQFPEIVEPIEAQPASAVFDE